MPGLKTITITNLNHFDDLDFKGLELKLIFTKDENDKLIPLKIFLKGYYHSEFIELVFKYFDYHHLDQFNLYQIAPSIGCNELRNFFEQENPDFQISNIMEIEFDDLSSVNDVKKTKIFIDQEEMIVRLEKDDRVFVIDKKNRIIFETDLAESNCEIEFFSSKSKFEELEESYLNMNLILDLKIEEFTFAGSELKDGYFLKKFENFLEDDREITKKVVLFKNVSHFNE